MYNVLHMTKLKKLVQKFSNDPTSVAFRDIKKIMFAIGFALVNTKGSHIKFKHQKYKFDIIIPVHNNDCKNFYKKEIYKKIKKEIKNIK